MDKDEYLKLHVNRKINEEEIKLLKHYASLIEDGGNILDVGTCEGGSAFALAIGSYPSVNIYTIDPTPNPRFLDHRLNLGFVEKVRLIQKKSQDADWNLPIDLIFHDGLHTYEGVREDIEKYLPFLKKGNLCLFHDYTLYNNTIGKAINEGEGKHYKKLSVIDNIYIAEKI